MSSDTDRSATELVSDWLIGHRTATRNLYRISITQYLGWLDREDHGDPLEVTRQVIQRYVRHLDEELGYAPSTVRNKVSAVASFYRYAVEERVVEHNPAEHVRRPKGESAPKRGLPTDQAQKVIAAARAHSQVAYALVWMMAGAALRVTEACTARLENINWETGLLTVTVKGGHAQTKPLSTPVLEAIRDATGDRTEGPILTNRDGNRLTRHRAFELIDKVAAAAGVEATPHTLRHTAATLALEAGASIEDVKELLGHSSIETTLLYLRGRDILGGTRRAADLLARSLVSRA